MATLDFGRTERLAGLCPITFLAPRIMQISHTTKVGIAALVCINAESQLSLLKQRTVA